MKLLILALLATTSVFANPQKVDTCLVLDENKIVEFGLYPQTGEVSFSAYDENFKPIVEIKKKISTLDTVVTNRGTGLITSVELNLGRSGSVKADLRRGSLSANIFPRLRGHFDIRCRYQKVVIDNGMAR